MRLIGKVQEEKQAELFCEFLRRKGVENAFEPSTNGDGGYLIWIEDEDFLSSSMADLQEFQENPADPKFTSGITLEPRIAPNKKKEIPVLKVRVKQVVPSYLTNFLIAFCAVVFFWNGGQELEVLKEEGPLALQVGMTSMQRKLLFDYPKAFEDFYRLVKEYSLQSLTDIENLPAEEEKKVEEAEHEPMWKGLYDYLSPKSSESMAKAPLFEKIKEGELWRFVTPIVLHGNFLHILFNMIWLWVLGKQIEHRVGKMRMLVMVVLVAAISNTAQYIMGGPFFLGFSGVACGMAGFIWVRQKVAPWEGYPLQKEAIYFLVFFVIAMFGLQFISFIVEEVSSKGFSLGIANTAHVAGFLIGMGLARVSYFAVK